MLHNISIGYAIPRENRVNRDKKRDPLLKRGRSHEVSIG
jgi:hypothetical protein